MQERVFKETTTGNKYLSLIFREQPVFDLRQVGRCAFVCNLGDRGVYEICQHKRGVCLRLGGGGGDPQGGRCAEMLSKRSERLTAQHIVPENGGKDEMYQERQTGMGFSLVLSALHQRCSH